MKKIAIINSGGASRGKSTTIRAVYSALRYKYEAIDTPLPDGDIKGVIQVEGVKIGIESQGDPNSRQVKSIDEFVAQGCDIIIAACRTRGETINRVRQLRSEGYTLIWASNLRSEDKPLQDNLNAKYTATITSIVNDFIKQPRTE